jgi:signal transduction histidine kinase
MMFRRARRDLTLLYIVLFALVLVVFTVVFYVAFVTVLAPAFDIAPEVSSSQAAEIAYEETIRRIALAVAIADAVAILIVGVAAWILATRTLDPIRAAHNRQRRFVADASHEIRNPLSAMKTTAQVALERDRSPAELRTALEVVVDAASRLTKLTNDLLTLASTDGLPERRSERFDLSVIAAEAVEALAPPVGDSPIRLDLRADVPALGDPDQISQIIRNLAENAVRHGGPGVRVTVATRSVDHDAVVEVRDSGPGIAAADIDQIFQPFYRVHREPSTDGNGLGLAIAADLATRNGGRLSVSSTPGNGATFRLTLPGLR